MISSMRTYGKCIVIYGATASGKSSLALSIARQCPSVIINADSMQVYNDLRILTACPSEEDMSLCSFKLYNFLSGKDSCTAALWAELASNEIRLAWDSGLLPIVVGGTGLYINSLLYGLVPIPDIPDDIRNKVRNMDFAEARQLLRQHDKVTFDTFPDKHRTMRALEVYLATGKTQSDWCREPRKKWIEAEWEKHFINLERKELYSRCDSRFLSMLEKGAIGEVEKLLMKKYPSSLPIMKALGVKEISLFLSGDITETEMISLAQARTRQYAKRQVTWFKKNN